MEQTGPTIFAQIQLEVSAMPKPEGYIVCECCGAILGYKAHIGDVLYLYLYSYAPHDMCPNLPERRVNARILNGDVFCPHCGTAKKWTAAANWPFDNGKK